MHAEATSPVALVAPQVLCQQALTFGLQCLAFVLLVRSSSRYMPLRIEREAPDLNKRRALSPDDVELKEEKK